VEVVTGLENDGFVEIGHHEPLSEALGSMLGKVLGELCGWILGSISQDGLGCMLGNELGDWWCTLGAELGKPLRCVLGNWIGERLGIELRDHEPLSEALGSMLGAQIHLSTS
jgi:hypothetical protein